MGLAAKYAKATKVQTPIAKCIWEKPRAKYLKLNVDTAFNDDDKAGASGAIIRDNKGVFI
jgi:hypothetical protein